VTGYLTEQQQIEQFKEWWKKNGVSIFIFFLIAFLSGVVWHYWLKHREVKLERGSTHYEELLSAVMNNDNDVAMREATLLKNNYSYTPYAALATLMIARNDVYQNNYSEAEKQLDWVMHKASSSSLRQVARLRLARLYIQENKPALALEIDKKVDNISYMPFIDEVKGDADVALGNPEKARVAYQQAMQGVRGYAVMRPLLVMKLDNLAKNTGE
jgi:predicted negative regulator of RcsB-dependent stress response